MPDLVSRRNPAILIIIRGHSSFFSGIESRSTSRIRTRYSLTCSSHSSAARAYPLI